jgi:hypothetical protein
MSAEDSRKAALRLVLLRGRRVSVVERLEHPDKGVHQRSSILCNHQHDLCCRLPMRFRLLSLRKLHDVACGVPERVHAPVRGSRTREANPSREQLGASRRELHIVPDSCRHSQPRAMASSRPARYSAGLSPSLNRNGPFPTWAYFRAAETRPPTSAPRSGLLGRLATTYCRSSYRPPQRGSPRFTRVPSRSGG